ncbi:GbsR/MarR family transcriptional regulator [Halobacillus naozhouensis]|uniref:HTH-type transcriptional regulator n=1 Tax=Halobacillus naozhouensis TaxID=554880 RepID=A0ABY8J4R2_9BACI|nr:GbsR/MarR family transcriptional regulator [Halobacillus naozhouensis]WFT77062.1 GbsR/MarR family transcriptional regulator [Halobacillus naozhouensis]
MKLVEEKPFDKTKEIEEQFIEKIADNMNTFGISTTVGRVLGTIYMNREPMTLDELSDSIGMSKTRMSQVVREMVDLNIAEKVFKKGVRKDLYNVERDYYQTFVSLFTSNWRKAISKSKMFEQKLQRELAEIEKEEALDEETEQKINELLKETRIWLDYYDWISRVTEFFESGEIFKHVPVRQDENK